MNEILPVHEKVKYLSVLEHFNDEKHKVLVHNIYNTKKVRERLVEISANNYLYGKRTNKYLVLPKIFNSV